MPSTFHRIAAALKEAFSDNEHRTQFWSADFYCKFLCANDATIARHEKEVEELKSAVQRSRSPSMRPKQRALPSAQGMLALRPVPPEIRTTASGKLRVAQARRVEAKVVLES